jgi:hypothetical protein
MTEESGFSSPLGQRNSSSLQRPDRRWGPPSLLLSGYLGNFFFMEAKWEDRELDHSHLSSVKVKNAWSYVSSFHMRP